MKPSGRPILAAFRRCYSAQAQAARNEKTLLPKQDSQVTRLGNGTVLASLENYSPIARLAVLFNAGPRHEPSNQPGLTHCLRNAFQLSNSKSTGFGFAKKIQQLGGSVGCTSTREQMVYTVTCLRDRVEEAAHLLCDAACKPAFLTHEIPSLEERMCIDHSIYMNNLEARLMEALHAVAFRGGLENSLYSPQHKIGQHTEEMLREYTSKYYTGGNMAIAGTGVSQDQLTVFARAQKMDVGPAVTMTPSKYQGGELRIDANTDLCYAAVGTEGFGMTSPDMLTLYVLQKVMGSGGYVKYGSQVATSKVARAAVQATSSPVAASCFNATYSDAGLFGFQVITQAADADKVLKSVGAAFGEATKGSITDADVQRAKNQLKAEFLMELGNADRFFLDFAIRAVLSGDVMSNDAILTELDKITTADVQNVAKKIFNGKPTMAAIGDLSNTPYLDQIF